MTEATALMLVKASSRSGVRMTPLEFVQSAIVPPARCHSIVKQVSPHWFRVRFWREVRRPDLLVPDVEWVEDKMFEVVEEGYDYRLVDRTGAR